MANILHYRDKTFSKAHLFWGPFHHPPASCCLLSLGWKSMQHSFRLCAIDSLGSRQECSEQVHSERSSQEPLADVWSLVISSIPAKILLPFRYSLSWISSVSVSIPLLCFLVKKLRFDTQWSPLLFFWLQSHSHLVKVLIAHLTHYSWLQTNWTFTIFLFFKYSPHLWFQQAPTYLGLKFWAICYLVILNIYFSP